MKDGGSTRSLQRHLRIIQTLYAVFFTLGLVKIYEYARIEPLSDPWIFFAVLAMTLFAIRFIFVLEALSQYLLVSKISYLVSSSEGNDEYNFRLNLKFTSITIFHYPIIFLHAYFFFNLCILYGELIQNGISDQWNPVYRGLNDIYAYFLCIYIVWLAIIFVNSVVDLFFSARFYLPRVNREKESINAGEASGVVLYC